MVRGLSLDQVLVEEERVLHGRVVHGVLPHRAGRLFDDWALISELKILSDYCIFCDLFMIFYVIVLIYDGGLLHQLFLLLNIFIRLQLGHA